ncbi:MAG: hypothetical protein ACTSQV_09445 [Alphaproteobacteria bacterium]
MKIPRLLQAVLVVALVYGAAELVFTVALSQPIPKSLMTMYMFFVVAGVLMVFTATEESARALTAPIKALVDDPSKKTLRNVVFVLVPLLAGAYAYDRASPSFEAPVELRSIHPAPPSTIKAYGKRYQEPVPQAGKGGSEKIPQAGGRGRPSLHPELPVLPRRQAGRPRALCGRAKPRAAQLP